MHISRPLARLGVALGLLAACGPALRADAPPTLAVARQQRVEGRALARPSALLGGVAHIGAAASSPVPDQPRILHLDPDALPPVLGAPDDFDASRVLPLLSDNARGTLQRVAGHDATVTLIGDDLYIQRRTLPPEEHVLSVRALWAHLGEAACGLTPTQVHYDAARHRWSLAAIADAGHPDAALLLAVSETSDPVGHWALQRLHLAEGGSFGALPPTVLHAGSGLRVRAGVLAEVRDGGACATDEPAASGEPAEWLLAAKDDPTAAFNPLTSPNVRYLQPEGGSSNRNTGTGPAGYVTFEITDPVSASDLRQGWVLINSTLDGRNACWVAYDVAANRLSLVNDAGTGVAGSITPGQAGTVENSQCVLDGSISFAGVTSATTIRINAFLRFKPAFGGTKLIYLYADDRGGENSLWQLRGYWLVPQANLTPFLAQYSYDRITATTATFQPFFTDPDGDQDLRQVWLLVNSTLDSRNACWVFYDFAAAQVGLVNDAGTGEAGRLPLGSTATVENSQCILYGGSGYGFFSITFKPAFNTAKRVYVYADDRAGQTEGWRRVSDYLGPLNNPEPVIHTISPRSGQGGSTTVDLEVSDPAGLGNLRQTGVLFNSTLSGVNACWITFDATTSRISLVNDAGTGLAGQVTPGQAGTAENSQCTITGVGAIASPSGDRLFVRVPVSFKAAFEGTRAIYAYVDNRTGQNSGWQVLGSFYVVRPGVPPIISRIPPSGSGFGAQIHAGFFDPNGAADIRQGWVLINSTLNGAGACWVFYDVPSGLVGLVNDAGTGEVGRIPPNSPIGIENSQCILTGGTLQGPNLPLEVRFSFYISFKPSFAGLKTMYLNAIDQGGLTTGWQPLGAWAVQ